MIIRPRRLRKNATIRNMVAETAVNPDSLVYPMFVVEGENVKEEIPSMPNQYRFSIDEILKELESCVAVGVKSILLFGIPSYKDEMATSAYDDDGIVQRAVRSI
jgi:porphobilinogen synthase